MNGSSSTSDDMAPEIARAAEPDRVGSAEG
jgi:hypothetical protein